MKKSTGKKTVTSAQTLRSKAADAALLPIWTDDQIDQLAYEDVNKDSKHIEDMDAKIERVAQRKKEAKDRALRLASKPISNPKPTLADYYQPASALGGDTTTAASVESKEMEEPSKCEKLASALNNYSTEYFQKHPDIRLSVESRLPLHYYDSSLFDEVLFKYKPSTIEDTAAVCLYLDNDNADVNTVMHFGAWYTCTVVNEDTPGVLQVLMKKATSIVSLKVPRVLCYFVTDPFEIITDRLQDALQRRHHASNLLQYHFQVCSMPFYETLNSTLDISRMDRIKKRAFSIPLEKCSPIVFSDEINEAKIDFENTMNRVILNAKTLRKYEDTFSPINLLPHQIVDKPSSRHSSMASKVSGCVKIPTHDMKSIKQSFEKSSYLCSSAALYALLSTESENTHVLSIEVLPTSYKQTYTLLGFERMLNDNLSTAIRTIKQEWPQRVASGIRRALQEDSKKRYDMTLRNVQEYESSNNPITLLLTKVNFMMTDVLTEVVSQAYLSFAEFVEALCNVTISVESISSIHVQYDMNSIYMLYHLPPLFHLSIRLSTEPCILNDDLVQQRHNEILAWDNTSAECPWHEIPPISGHAFEYDAQLSDFKNVFLTVFETLLLEFGDIAHVRKYVMERIYFPVQKTIGSVDQQSAWLSDVTLSVVQALDRAISPVAEYLILLKPYEAFMNLDNNEYIHETVKVTRRDMDSTEIELPVTVNLNEVVVFLDKHMVEMENIQQTMPKVPLDCGLFSIHIDNIRNMLLEKHRQIIQSCLMDHSMYSREICKYVDVEFRKILTKISLRPVNIEDLVQLEEYMSGVGTTLAPLQTCITDMMAYHDILDDYHFKIDAEHFSLMWTVVGYPEKVLKRCRETTEQNLYIKRRFREEMQSEQSIFLKELDDLETEIRTLEEYHELSDVKGIAVIVQQVNQRMLQAQEKVKQYNFCEGLFEVDVTDYEDLVRLQKMFDPFSNLWLTTQEWLEMKVYWRSQLFIDLNAEDMEQRMDQYQNAITKAFKYFSKADMESQANIANLIKNEISEFSPEVPLIVTLRNPGMRDRHWSEIAAHLNVTFPPLESMTTEYLLSLNLKDYFETIQKIGESAAKEYQIEHALDKMLHEWENMNLDIHTYRETGTHVLKGVDDINVVLDEQITMTQAIMFSAFKGPFEVRIEEWNRKLCLISDVLEVWIKVQRNWLYLQPIFESADINRQLPVEGKKFEAVDKNWRTTLAAAKVHPKIIEFCDNDKLLERFKDSEKSLDEVQKGLNDYLETKRSVFARFYFLSNDELLSILSESKDVELVQPHLKKCFEGIDKVHFLEDLKIDKFISPEGEEITCSSVIDPVGSSVEQWMLRLESIMRESIRMVMFHAIQDYTTTSRSIWMQKWPGMVVLNGSQLHWTREMESLFLKEGGMAPHTMYERQVSQLAEMTILVRGKLSSASRITVGALTVIDVHARDVIKKLVDDEVSSADHFSWMSQLRYYWQEDNLQTEMVAARRPYGYEYLGNTFRLVITPLTDKCYLTLMGALQMIFGGAPAGPAGTGKTETTKDLAKALAMQCVVFNCSDGLDYIAMGKFFKGLAACGAWACFDEFNRINIEVLSVIGQQIMSIQSVIRAKEKRMYFENSEIAVSDRFSVFITMNPGYAGRSALPDSLQALFRPVAMMVPDYALIGEIMFFAYGFEHAKECGAKMVTTFKLCSEQLSAQAHYDYGMRAVKTVITAAGNLKRAEPNADEMVLLLRALQDVNIPKFLEMDLPLYAGIISDLFPGKVRPQLDYGALMHSMKQEIHKNKLQPVSFFTSKVIQLYEMIVVRHGLMLVGPTGGGKSSNLHILRDTLTSLKKDNISGFVYEKIIIYQLNPKSITMGQMYGEADINTMEWKDGIMSTMYRTATIDSPDRKWIVFDGPVDAIWIENMNTVLDDNKKLCLNSGEIIKMSNEMTMMFEVEDLLVASPATVSRVGIIYMEPRGLGLDVLMISWLDKSPTCVPILVKSKLTLLFDTYLHPSISYLRSYLKEIVPTVDNNLCESLMRILDCYIYLYVSEEGKPTPTEIMIADLVTCIEPLFIFALIWSVGATINEDSRKLFDAFLRAELYSNKFSWQFPKKGMVYDYLFTMETKRWIPWMDISEPFTIDSKLGFSEIVVPTTDSVRNTYLLDILLTREKHVLMVGNTGTGKTINISQYLSGASKVNNKVIANNIIPLVLMFSANTSANMTQDLLDSKMDKRKKGVYGPAAGKKFYVYVDDLNMPKQEEYGAQPPIELLRQWFDQGGWYDRKDLSFRKIIDLTYVASMGPPGGGRQSVSPRFLRHFNIIGYVELSDTSKALIFGTILRSFLSNFENDIVNLTDIIVSSSVSMFDVIMRELLPTPSKTHYTFNLRDLAKIFQGMLMVESKKINQKEQIARLWVHESMRVFGDRLTCTEDHDWLRSVLKENIEKKFNMDWKVVVPRERLVYCDFITPSSSTSKLYEEVTDMDQLKKVVEDYLTEHNQESKSPMPLVIFTDALEHVARISRLLRQPQGNALLLGVGGSGRQSMTKLANYIAGYDLKTVEIVKGYSMLDWREDLKAVLMQAGIKDRPTTFLFSDVQIINERMVEDINNILNAGDVPNLYAAEDFEAISSACRVECQKRKIPPTKINIFNQYIFRVRKNIHLCIAMSPLGEAFRNRLRNYPSLVNCCTIDWFTNWPAEALQSVGTSILQKNKLDLSSYEAATVQMFKEIHLSVEHTSKEFYSMLRRRNYVTPTSYLELLSSFAKLILNKRAEISTKITRLQSGLDKLSETKSVVGTMQEELKILQPQLVATQQEVSSMMIVITKDKASAAQTKALVEVEEKNANEKAADAKAIAEDAQRDLAEAIPALNEAVKCLDELKKSDIDELKAMGKPPAGVVLTMKVCCLMFPETKIIKKNDPNNPGKKFDDYWESGQKGLLAEAKVFIDQLKTYDKDNIPDKIIRSVEPFMIMEEFSPAAISKASKACTAICMWARAMYKYHFVALGVAPKRARLHQAEEELTVVMEQLSKAKATLQDVNDRLVELELAYNESIEKKDALEKKQQSCMIQLKNADKLIGGLGGEETRWRETVMSLNIASGNVLGDVLVSAATISYLGPFTSEFRQRLVSTWQKTLMGFDIPHTRGCNVEVTLADPVKVRSWQLCSLPSDSLSTQNAIIMDNGRRWPLLIDPQGQANRYIRSMAKDSTFAENGMDVIKLSDKNFLRTLENGIQLGRWVLLENILETLDAAIEPILLQLTFKQGGQEVMKLGDNIIPYNNSFRFFMTTKLSNPHYAPEVQVKVSLLNFTITLTGLEEQLLGVVVTEELPDLALQKANLVIQNAYMNKQLYDIESEILLLLSKSEGNILDDTVLIETLAQSKKTSEEIKEKMFEATHIEEEITMQSEFYRPVAKRASLLYFVIADLGQVDPMYQYSLPWFTQLFVRSIAAAVKSNDLNDRISNLNDYFTYSVYINICRSLFEKHKLLFSFIMCVSILQGNHDIDPSLYRFLLSGISNSNKIESIPIPTSNSNWLEENVWSDLCILSGLPSFSTLPTLFQAHIDEWEAIFDSNEPHRIMEYPEPCQNMSPLQRLCILRCLRRDKMEPAMQDFISFYLDTRYIQPPAFDLRSCYNDSTVTTPLIFILSSGSDPNKDLDVLADELNMKERLKRIALGQGQGNKAMSLVTRGMETGQWVLLQNCHLSISWMPVLEQICENMEPDRIHPDFRLWLTSMPSESFPTSCLQNGVKITKEPPKGLRANLKSTYMKLDNEKLLKTNKTTEFQKLLFGLSFYHAIVIERKKFGPLGWNIPYEFNDTDMDITAAQLELYVSLYAEIPYKVLQQLASVVNYGGRVTDDKDMRTSDIIIADFFQQNILQPNYTFSRSGVYYSIIPDVDSPYSSYMEYIESLPLNAEPEVFGMHENASITCAITEADNMFDIILTLQPRVATGVGASREDAIISMAFQMEIQLPSMYDIEALMLLYPTDYHESMNTVLVQEAERYNRLLQVMHQSLRELQRALKGLVTLSAELEAMGDAMFDQRVPSSWSSAAYPSLKPLGSWFKDILQRLNFITLWIEKGTPAAYWISGFFFPQGFLTAIIQNYSRKFQYPIDTVSFSFVMRNESLEDLLQKPTDGSYVYGMFLEGARWDKKERTLIDPKPKELFSSMPVIHMLPQKNRPLPTSGIYRCPVYKILTRTGTLSTTGHSTNFVTWIEIPSNKPTIFRSSLVSETNAQIKLCDQDYWIKAGVACFCALRY